MSESEDNEIINNTIRSNLVEITDSSYNILINNTFINSGLILNGWKKSYWNTHTIDLTNTINGKPIRYWKNIISGIVGSDAGQVILANCTGVTVEEQNISNVPNGISLGFSDGNNIIDNELSRNSVGINLEDSDNNIISNNTSSLNFQEGILISESYDNILEKNIIKSNKNVGVHISESSDNIVNNNTFNKNSQGVGIFSSDRNIISNNTIIENNLGVYLRYSKNNNISNNFIDSNVMGVEVDCEENILVNNTLKRNVLSLRLEKNNSVSTSNSVNGHPVYYISNSNNTIFKNLTAGHITISDCYNVTLYNITTIHGDGIIFSDCNDSKVISSTSSCNFAGVRLQDSTNILIEGSNLTANQYGLFVGGKLTLSLDYMFQEYFDWVLDIHNNSIHNCTIAGNAQNSIYNSSSDIENIDARWNFFGSNQETQIDASISASDAVYSSWLSHRKYGISYINTTETWNTQKNVTKGLIVNGNLEILNEVNFTDVNGQNFIQVNNEMDINGANLYGNNIPYSIVYNDGSKGYISDSRFENQLGVGCTSPDDIEISNSIFTKGYSAIQFKGISNTTISGNIIEKCNGFPLYLAESINVSVVDNELRKHSGGVFTYVENGTYHHNDFLSGWNIQWMTGGENNSIYSNQIEDGFIGLIMAGENNTIYHNNFLDNVIQAWDAGKNNRWDNGYPSGGNYWSDYTGNDFYSGPNQDQPGSDGIGDTNYTIYAVSNSDEYPLMSPYGKSNGYTVHPPIRINNNSDLASEAISGNGTQPDPYVIEGYEIDGTGYGYCMYIGNTSDHFVVRDCYLHNASGNMGTYWENTGLYFYNVMNGIAENNTMIDNTYGIYLYLSNTTILNKNSASNSGAGISLVSSEGNKILNNVAVDNWGQGIDIELSNNNTIDNNTVNNNDDGILISSSVNNTVTNNTMVDDGIVIDGNKRSHWNTHHIDKNNTINDKRVEYWKDEEGGTVPSDAGGVILANCTSVSVKNQNISDGTIGVLLGFSDENKIVHNNASMNNDFGVHLCYSHNNTIANNTIRLNVEEGLYLTSSNNNTIINNTLNSNPYGSGVRLDSSNENMVDGNKADKNGDFGIFIVDSRYNAIINNTASDQIGGVYLTSSRNNTILNNSFSNTEYGFYLAGSENNTFTENAIWDNVIGIRVLWSDNNTFYHNNLINNDNQVYGSGENIWNASYPTGGNYWSDYTGSDIYSGPNQDQPGSDGIGDTNYTIDGGPSADEYPLMNPLGLPHVTATQPTHDETNVPTNQQVKVTFSRSMNTSRTPTLEQISGPVVNYNFAGWSNTSIENDTATWTHPYWQTNTSISLLVSDYCDENGNIGPDYSWNFTTSQSIDISNNSKLQTNPSIWGDLVVWEDYRNDDNGEYNGIGLDNVDIYMYNISSGDLTWLVKNTEDQRNPVIWKNYVVWEDYRNGNSDIYYIDLTDPSLTENQLTSDPEDQVEPSIHDGKIVWTDHRNGSDGEIYLHDLEEGATYILYSGGKLSEPDIYGDKIVFKRSIGFPSNADILLYNLTDDHDNDGLVNYKDPDATNSENVTYNLNNDSIDQKSPSIYKDIVSYTEYRSKSNNLLFMRIGHEKQIISNNDSHEEHSSIYGYRIAYAERHYESGNHTYDAVWFYDMLNDEKHILSKIDHEPWHADPILVQNADIHSNNFVWQEKHNSTDPNITYQYSIFLRSLDKKPPSISDSSVSSDGTDFGLNATMKLMPGSTLEFRANVTDIDDDLEEVYLNVSSLDLTEDKIMMNEMGLGVYNCTLHYDPSLPEGSRNVSIFARDENNHSATGKNLNLTFSVEHAPVIEEALVGNSTDNLDVEANLTLEPGNQLIFRVIATDEDGDLSSVYVNTSELNTTQNEYRLNQDTNDPDVYRLTLDYQDPMTPGEKTVTVYAVDDNGHNDSAELTVHAEEPVYDTFPPSIIKVLPKDGVQGITLDRDVKVIFNETMDTNTQPNIENLNDLTEDWNFQGWESTNVAHDTAVWSHDKWENDLEISVRLWNYYDSSSNLGSTYTWRFNTMPGPEFDYVRHSSVTNVSTRLTARFTLGNYSSVNVSFNYRRAGTTAWYNTDSVEYKSTSIHQHDITELSANTTYEYTALIDYKDGTIFYDTNTFDTEEEVSQDDDDQDKGFDMWMPLMVLLIIILLSIILFMYLKQKGEKEEVHEKEEIIEDEKEIPVLRSKGTSEDEPESEEEPEIDEDELEEYEEELQDTEDELEDEPEDAEIDLEDEFSDL